eukprot:CFRG4340T1
MCEIGHYLRYVRITFSDTFELLSQIRSNLIILRKVLIIFSEHEPRAKSALVGSLHVQNMNLARSEH